MSRFDWAEQANTVAYSGLDLDELIAASGEVPVFADLADVEIDVETTVVIPGSRAPEQSSGSFAALAYTVTQPMVVAPRRRSFLRDGAAFTIAAVGLLLGVVVAMSISVEPPAGQPRTVVARAIEKSTRVSETTPLVSPTHQKATTTKRPTRSSASVTRINVRPAAAAAAVTPRADDAAEDAQVAADRRLVLAAQLERSL